MLVLALVAIPISGIVTLVDLCDTSAVCFAPSDPATATIGFSTAPDGGMLLVLGPHAARQTTELLAYPAGAGAGSETEPPPLWRVERTGPSDWDGTVELGQTPPGFRETVPLRDPSKVRGVLAGNGCYGAYQDTPWGLPPAGKVTAYGDTFTLAGWLSDGDYGFSTCPTPGVVKLSAVGAGALTVMALSVVALVVRGVLLVRWRRRSA